MAQREVFIVGSARTPIGSLLGALADVAAPRLAEVAIRAALERAGIAARDVDEVFLGCVLSAGIGQAPARQAALFSGIEQKTPCTTVNKVCGSGLQSVILAARAIRLGEGDILVAGGMESMSRVPYYLAQARTGYRMGHGQLVDGMIHDGLWDPYKNFHMGNAAELCARELAFTREAQDAYARESYSRALAAISEGRFAREIAKVKIPQKTGEVVVAEDEEPGRGKPEKMGALKPAFEKDGTVTAANASKIDDGAAALVLASDEAVRKRGLEPLARIVGWAGHAQAPEWFTTAPVGAIEAVLRRTGLGKADIDLWEINEAFAVVAMAAIQKVGLDAARVNVNGGAVALGHPIGATGARLVVTLLGAMQDRQAKRGVASLCIGGGEALALVVERSSR
ncbi:MAG: thiolase family protein [Deltaproteobacteria bacterium]|nr:thiolase family protein [Deltaproteobacteria bacterium]